MLQKSALYLVALILIAAAAFLHKDSYRLFPMHIHAWAQADHLALTEGFIENGYDLFHPQTYILNPQFPNDFKIAYPSSITAADMPFHAYTVAIIMGITGIHEPGIFRLYTLLWSLIGLFFLFRLSRNITRHTIWALFITLAAAFSPVFVYYQDGFLPSIPCLTAVIIGLTYYFNYLENQQKRTLYIALFWLMMAALWRTSLSIALIAILCTEGFKAIRDKRFVLRDWIALLLPTIPILAYILYNSALRAEYGSIFLSSPRPPGNWEDFKDITDIAINHWGLDYFSKWQWFYLVPTLAIGLFVLLKRALKLKQIAPQDVFTLGFAFGSLCFTLLMYQQFTHHDYYFIDTLFLPVLLIAAYGFSKIPVTPFPYARFIFVILLILFAGKAFVNAHLTQKRRHTTEPWDRYTATAINFKDANRLLDSLGISKDAKLLVLDAYAPNIPLMQMKRKGFVVLNTVKEELENGLTFPYDYVAFQNDYLLSDILTAMPDFIDKFEYLGGNSHISIYKDRVDTSNQSMEEFLGLNKRTLLLDSRFDDATTSSTYWKNIYITNSSEDSASTEGEIIGEFKEEVVFHAGDLRLYPNSVRQIRLSLEVLIPEQENANFEIVEYVHKDDVTFKYMSFPLNSWVKEKGKWQQINLLMSPPIGGLKGDEELKLVLKNPDHGKLFYRAFRVQLYH